jgi:hypothetical protein
MTALESKKASPLTSRHKIARHRLKERCSNAALLAVEQDLLRRFIQSLLLEAENALAGSKLRRLTDRSIRAQNQVVYWKGAVAVLRLALSRIKRRVRLLNQSESPEAA